MVKIREANRNGTLAVSLDNAMKAEGYVKGVVCDWVRGTDGWLLKTRQIAPVAQMAETKKEVGGDGNNIGGSG